jgi:hypothetical protein
MPIRTIATMVRTYDLAMTHKLNADDYFIQCVQRRCESADPQKGMPDEVAAGVAARLVEWAKGLIDAKRS